jgi:predicted acetyltransferase
MDIEIRPVDNDEFEAFGRATERAFGSHPVPEEVEEWRRVFEPGRFFAAFDAGDIVGTGGQFTMTLTVPGGEVPMAGVTAIGVAPTHRRRGLLTSLMRRLTEDSRERGEAVAALWASEASIYQRFGYGMATFAGWAEIERERTAFARPFQPRGAVRLLDRDAAFDVFPPLYERVRRTQPGTIARSRAWWEHVWADLESWRDGASALFFGLYETTDGPEGYVVYRIKQDWSQGVPNNRVRVRELVATSSDALAALWRYCFDIDLVTKIECWPRPVDDPLLYLLAEPRRWNLRLGDGLWVRLLDVPEALAARRYREPGWITFEVRDSFCPWNEGRLRLEGGPDGAECAATDDEPDLVVGASDLGAAYLGGASFATLARAGRVVELTEGALGRAGGLFGWDPQPHCGQLF